MRRVGDWQANGIKITASTKLSQTEKDRIIRETEQFAEQDKRAKEEAEMRNTADSLIYTSERTLGEIGKHLHKAKVADSGSVSKG